MYAAGRFGFRLHEVDRLESSVVVYDDEHILVAADLGSFERAGDVGVY